MSGNPRRWTANPTAAVVVSVVTLIIGIWLVRTAAGSELIISFGWTLVVIGVLGAAANLYIRHQWRD